MMNAPMNLDELIRSTHELSPDGSELERLAAAASLSDELDVLADRLTDHFVQAAREAGCSWAQIGQHLGVTKQAAQQRFVVRSVAASASVSQPLERGTDRAQRVLVHAQQEARTLGHDYLGTEHLLLGILDEPQAMGATVLDALGVSRQSVREEVEKRIGLGLSAPTGSLPFTPRAKKALELSCREARGFGHKYVETEHLLLGLVRVRKGFAAKTLNDFGANEDQIRQTLCDQLSR